MDKIKKNPREKVRGTLLEHGQRNGERCRDAEGGRGAWGERRDPHRTEEPRGKPQRTLCACVRARARRVGGSPVGGAGCSPGGRGTAD